MKLMYKGAFQEGKVEKYREYNEVYKSVYQTIIIGGEIKLHINHYCIDIDKNGQGYISIKLDKGFPKYYIDMKENKQRKIKNIDDINRLKKIMIKNGFFITKQGIDYVEEDFADDIQNIKI